MRTNLGHANLKFPFLYVPSPMLIYCREENPRNQKSAFTHRVGPLPESRVSKNPKILRNLGYGRAGQRSKWRIHWVNVTQTLDSQPLSTQNPATNGPCVEAIVFSNPGLRSHHSRRVGLNSLMRDSDPSTHLQPRRLRIGIHGRSLGGPQGYVGRRSSPLRLRFRFSQSHFH